MNNYVKYIENRMSDDEKDMLKKIYSPTVVATPLADSRRYVCVLPSGEIRAYSKYHPIAGRSGDIPRGAYLSSVDGGLSWSTKYSKGIVHSCSYFEEPDIYLAVDESDGLCVYRSKIGPDDEAPEIIRLAEKSEGFHCSFLPQKSDFCDRVWFTSEIGDRAFFFFSDDWGKSWEKREIAPIKPFETVFPHKGTRWCVESGREPYAVELSEGKMMMILRTPLDCFYLSYSYDRGNSWTEPEESIFYGTDTTAFLLRLSDERIIAFWNNTRPLPEPNHNATLPPVGDHVKKGFGEDAFTNRDAAHAAISEDGGESFIGFREIILNPIRNNADFRHVGDVRTSLDKSVHQFQAFELPFNKVLVSAGQNSASRRLLIFDVNWLYETSRKEDFLGGLGNITAHTYIKSVSDSHAWRLGNGHCAWNRAMSAYPMPDPDGGPSEALLISKHHDERLINDIGGATWNFPASPRGRVDIVARVIEKQARFILSDRWFNTCDRYAHILSPFFFEISKEDVGDGFFTLSILYDTVAGRADVLVNGERIFSLKMSRSAPTGLSYLIMQCDTDGDSKGFYVRSLEKTTL